jgi:galactose mutarotase-like enzyme
MNARGEYHPPLTTLSNDAMQVQIAADLGGKIVSLRSKATGREWLWRNPYLPLSAPPLDPTDFGPYDSGGWDEIFPTVNPCVVADSPWASRRITDHGVLWHRPWQTPLPDNSTPTSQTLVVSSPNLPFRFERKLTLGSGSAPLVAEYVLANRDEGPLPYIWAAHPLFAVFPGMKLVLPEGLNISIATSIGLDFAAREDGFIWPIAKLADGRTFDFSRVPSFDSGVAAKLFSGRLKSVRVGITSECESETLSLELSSSEPSCVGLWLNYSAWSGVGTPPYFNCGIEPTTSPCDDLEDAIRHGSAAILQPGEVRRWSLAVSLK